MSSNVVFMGSSPMQCEWCKSNIANFKFADSHLDNGTTKVVCASCFHILSLSSIRQDLRVLNQKVSAIERKVGADLDQTG